MIVIPRMILAALVLGALLLTAGPVRADEVTVISHSGISLTAAELKDVFLGEKLFVGSTRLFPIDNSASQEQFQTRVLRIQSNKYSAVWTKKAFRDGTNPPPIRSGDAETLEFVKRTPGAVGYLAGGVTAGVNVVGKF